MKKYLMPGYRVESRFSQKNHSFAFYQIDKSSYKIWNSWHPKTILEKVLLDVSFIAQYLLLTEAMSWICSMTAHANKKKKKKYKKRKWKEVIRKCKWNKDTLHISLNIKSAKSTFIRVQIVVHGGDFEEKQWSY